MVRGVGRGLGRTDLAKARIKAPGVNVARRGLTGSENSWVDVLAHHKFRTLRANVRKSENCLAEKLPLDVHVPLLHVPTREIRVHRVMGDRKHELAPRPILGGHRRGIVP